MYHPLERDLLRGELHGVLALLHTINSYGGSDNGRIFDPFFMRLVCSYNIRIFAMSIV